MTQPDSAKTLGEIAVVGGTGALGSGLAYRWARAGLKVAIGSRDAGKASEKASEISGKTGVAVTGDANAAVAAAADIVVLSVPFAQRDATLDAIAPHLAGKVLIDCTVPLVPPKVGRVQLQQSGAAVLAVQERLGEGVKVVSAFQNIGAPLLQSDADEIACDVLVCSDDKDAAETGIALCDAAGLRGIAAGPLANAVCAEALTSILITINRKYGAHHAGIRITGLPEGGTAA